MVELDMASVGNNRQFCATENRRLGWVTRNAKVGDMIVTFYGAKVPYVVRKRSDGSYRFIGQYFCKGLMRGSGFKPDIDGTDFELK